MPVNIDYFPGIIYVRRTTRRRYQYVWRIEFTFPGSDRITVDSVANPVYKTEANAVGKAREVAERLGLKVGSVFRERSDVDRQISYAVREV